MALVWRATCERFPGAGVQVALRSLERCAARELHLGDAFAYPVVTIDAVKTVSQAGVVTTMPAAAWRWDRPDTLVKQHIGDATGAVFLGADPYRPFDWPLGWWIEATIGEDPPGDVLQAASQLACELVLAKTDPEKCSLPDNVRSITRQGTTIEFDRTQWAALPILQDIAKPYPEGYGCAPIERGLDPAHPHRWAEIPWADLP